MSVTEQWSRVWGFVKGSSAEVIRSVVIPPERVYDSGERQPHFVPGKSYFSVIINEMFLAKSRQWFNLCDPMALVVSEFTYDGKRATVPVVVGPSMLEGKVKAIPGADGIAITDTMVAGVHPYAGGKFALTLIFAQIKRESYAKRLLQVVENVACVFPVGSALDPYLQVAGAVMDGIESLFGMDETKALACHRWEYNDGITPWLEPGFFALVSADERNVEEGQPSVVRARLRNGVGETAPHFRSSDYLLYSLRSTERRADITELPFWHIFDRALHEAASREKGSWDRAKAALVTLYQEMLTSPDLTWDQVQELCETLKQRLVEAHKRAQSFTVLGGDLGRETRVPPNSTAGAFNGVDGAARLQKLGEIHKLLEL